MTHIWRVRLLNSKAFPRVFMSFLEALRYAKYMNRNGYITQIF